MSTHKRIDRICIAAVALALTITIVFMGGESLGLQSAARTMGYERRLFDTDSVHTVDIVTDDWDAFITDCENEEYVSCAVVIDNESFKNVGIRAKGNTSLRNVSAMGSKRYSFKLEFDHYADGKSYHGLDKLSLNNIIQDNTYMKDYLTYRLMAENGVCAPLCSFVYITVNGEDWGLYLAVEGVEDAFLQRNYGRDSGELYKPDSMSFGGGRGNGKDFNLDFDALEKENADKGGTLPSSDEMPQRPDFSQIQDGDFDPEQFKDFKKNMPGGFGQGSADVKLQYTDDSFESYSNIFDNAKTDISDTDKERLIESLRKLSEGEELETVLDIEQVLRYFVVHNFVVNADSYTGTMVHNYYLYEKDGQLSMIPWDYNLAFGTFQGNNASAAVNDPIDTPLSVTGDGQRPMADWIASSEAYTAQYHELFASFLKNTDIDEIIRTTHDLIAPYVEKDPTKFCTAEEFENGVSALRTFCALRTESVLGQLDGTIPSTSEGQQADSRACIDTGTLNLSDMGTMSMGAMGGNRPQNGEKPTVPEQAQTQDDSSAASSEDTPSQSNDAPSEAPNGEVPPDMPDFGDFSPPNGGSGQFPGFGKNNK